MVEESSSMQPPIMQGAGGMLSSTKQAWYSVASMLLEIDIYCICPTSLFSHNELALMSERAVKRMALGVGSGSQPYTSQANARIPQFLKQAGRPSFDGDAMTATSLVMELMRESFCAAKAILTGTAQQAKRRKMGDGCTCVESLAGAAQVKESHADQVVGSEADVRQAGDGLILPAIVQLDACGTAIRCRQLHDVGSLTFH